MSSGTTFSIYKVHDKLVDQNLKNAIIAGYRISNEKYHEKDLDSHPRFASCSYPHDVEEDVEIDSMSQMMYIDLETGNRCTRLGDFDIGSGLKDELWEEFNITCYDNNRKQNIIDRKEAERILEAIRYILSKNYLKEFEDIMSNKWIKILGASYSPYQNFRTPDERRWYLEKTGRGQYTVTEGDNSWKREIDEEDEGTEFTLNKIRVAMETFLNIDNWKEYSKEEHNVLVVSAW